MVVYPVFIIDSGVFCKGERERRIVNKRGDLSLLLLTQLTEDAAPPSRKSTADDGPTPKIYYDRDNIIF